MHWCKSSPRLGTETKAYLGQLIHALARNFLKLSKIPPNITTLGTQRQIVQESLLRKQNEFHSRYLRHLLPGRHIPVANILASYSLRVLGSGSEYI